MTGHDAGERLQARYVERFACAAAECTSTCCVGWRIDVDRESYERMREAAAASEEARAELDRNIVVTDEPRADRRRHALIVLRDDESCSFLDPDRLCSLHRRFGPAALSDLCATYPRELRAVRGRVEVTATLSCPVIARAVLLDGDANELVRAPAEATATTRLRASIPEGASPWFDAVDDVRAGIAGVLCQTRAPLRARLAAIGCAAAESRAWFHRSAQSDARDALREAFDRYATAEALGTLDRELESIEGRGERSAGLLMSYLEAIPKSAGSALRALITSIGDAYATRDGATRLDAVYAAYQRRRARWTARHAAEIDGYFTSWTIAYVIRDWYVDERDLVAYVIRVLVRVATLRFLLISHPALDAVEDADEATRRRVLDETVVSVVQTYTRDVEHAGSVVVELDARVRERAPTIAHALFLLDV